MHALLTPEGRRLRNGLLRLCGGIAATVAVGWSAVALGRAAAPFVAHWWRGMSASPPPTIAAARTQSGQPSLQTDRNQLPGNAVPFAPGVSVVGRTRYVTVPQYVRVPVPVPVGQAAVGRAELYAERNARAREKELREKEERRRREEQAERDKQKAQREEQQSKVRKNAHNQGAVKNPSSAPKKPGNR
jgi:hypothetical protein